MLMNTLPTAIEEALKDAGFTQTEILIMRRLIEEQSLPLRQLAAKTGKSTGVLDQAMKKLMKKGIVSKEMINDSPVYTFVSLEAVMQAIEEDTEHKREMLKRRYENFEAFVNSLAFDKQRPEIESFQGDEGLKRAYCKLLESGRELLVYQPTHDEEEDPALADFRVEYFRERRRRNIYSRVIAHNTPLGRKFQGRDAFEFRKTFLVDPAECAFTFEKLIIGSAVACFNHAEKRACIIRYPELAQTERTLFEALWNEKTSAAVKEPVTGETVTPPTAIPWKVRTLSQLRNFFISPQSLAVFAVFAVIAGAITFGLYRQNVYLNTQRVRERVKAIAATAAPQFDWRDLEELQSIDDITKPEYAKVIYHLNEVRRQNEGVKYAYIFRKTDDESMLQFIVDADSIDPFAEKDLNGDGVIDDADGLNYPGQTYEVPEFSGFNDGFVDAGADKSPYKDQWGTFISGYAPIRDDAGNAVAIIGVDMFSDDVGKLSRKTFSALGTFIGIFLLFVAFRLAAFNRSLASELLGLFNKLNTIFIPISCFLLVLLAAGIFSWHSKTTAGAILTLPLTVFVISIIYFFISNRISPQGHFDSFLKKRNFLIVSAIFQLIFWVIFLNQSTYNREKKDQISERLMAIAATAATQFNPVELDQLRKAGDMRSDVYQKIFSQLLNIRKQNTDIRYVYILRSTDFENLFEFVADADSNFYLSYANKDLNEDGSLDQADLNVAPGTYYFSIDQVFNKAKQGPTHSKDIFVDQWGSLLTGAAPIQGAGKFKYLIGIDIFAMNETNIAFFISLFTCSILFLLGSFFVKK